MRHETPIKRIGKANAASPNSLPHVSSKESTQIPLDEFGIDVRHKSPRFNAESPMLLG